MNPSDNAPAGTPDFIIGRLTFLLRRYNRLVLRHSRVSLTLLPLTTTLQFEGHPLSSLITPPINGDAAHRRYIFDVWLSPLTEPGGDPEKELLDVVGLGGDTLLAFMKNHGGKPSNFYESTVRLLYALGNVAGASIQITDNTILVTHDGLMYGIKAGTTMSRFASDIALGEGNPLEILNRTETVEMDDPLFALLYREAYMRGKHLIHALTALRTGNPYFDFKRLVTEQYRRRVGKKKLQGWETIVMTARDPVGALYEKLVPTWMSRMEFDRHIAWIQHRKYDLPEDARIRVMNKMHVYFNQKGKEQK